MRRAYDPTRSFLWMLCVVWCRNMFCGCNNEGHEGFWEVRRMVRTGMLNGIKGRKALYEAAYDHGGYVKSTF